VRYEGSQPILYIRYLYAREQRSPEQLERTRYVVSTTQRNFIALGRRLHLAALHDRRHPGAAELLQPAPPADTVLGSGTGQQSEGPDPLAVLEGG